MDLPCDIRIQNKLKWLLESRVPMLLAQEDNYNLITLDTGGKRNVEEEWRGTIVFIGDTLSQRYLAEDEGGFFSDDQAEDLQDRDLRLQIDFTKKSATQQEASELVAQIRENVTRNAVWIVDKLDENGDEVKVQFIVEQAVLVVPPDQETSDTFLHVAISLVFGYSILGGHPRKFQ